MKNIIFQKKELADITGIDERTITRMRTKEDYLPSLEFIIACCIAMSLLPWESDKLIDLAGYKLRTNLKIERGYIALIHVFYQCSIDECNEFLEQTEKIVVFVFLKHRNGGF